MKLMDLTTNQLMVMEIKEYLADESIEGIRLLARNPEKGFARQFGLTTEEAARILEESAGRR